MIGLIVARALASPIGQVPLQGFLTDASGQPVDEPVDVVLTLYDAPVAGTALWFETQAIDPVAGAFDARLGAVTDLDLELFRTWPTLWLGIAVGADSEMTRVALDHVPHAAWAEFAGDALTLDGNPATAFALASEPVSWSDLAGVPLDLLDGDDGQDWLVGYGLLLDGDVLSVDPLAVTDVCYDTEDELIAAIADLYLPADYVPSWVDLQDVPADLLDGDDNTVWIAGNGLLLDGDLLSLDPSVVSGLCLDNEDELHALLDGDYLPASYTPSWEGLTDIPPDLLDGDADTPCEAGFGLLVDGDTLSLDAVVVGDLCYDTEDELLDVLADDFLPIDWTPSWFDLAGVPPDVLNGDDTIVPGEGLTLDGDVLSVDAGYIDTLVAESLATDPTIVHQQEGTDLVLSRGRVWRENALVHFEDAAGTVDTLDTTGMVDGELRFATLLALQDGPDGTDSALSLDLTSFSSYACTLFHSEDDVPRPGLYMATDASGHAAGVWPDGERPTFVLSRQGASDALPEGEAEYVIVCL